MGWPADIVYAVEVQNPARSAVLGVEVYARLAFEKTTKIWKLTRVADVPDVRADRSSVRATVPQIDSPFPRNSESNRS